MVYNMIALFYALFFMIGRRAYRENERIRAQEDVIIRYPDNTLSYEAKTVDLSENGIAFYVPVPIYLPEHKTISLVVKSSRYEAKLDAVIVYVKADGEGWRYSATVQPLSETDNRQYMQLIYDRKHSLPEQMNLWDTAYDDMLRNVKKRMVQPKSDQRKMPRLSLNLPVTFTNHASCTLLSFNYRFFSATDLRGNIAEGAEITFYTESNIEVVLKHTGKTTANRHEVLLSVENIDEILGRGLIDQLLSDLIHPQAKLFTKEG